MRSYDSHNIILVPGTTTQGFICNSAVLATCRHGQKLDFARIQALLYTIGLVYDKRAVSQTTVPSYTDHMAVR